MQRTSLDLADFHTLDDEWERLNECCQTAAGRLDPVFTAEASVTDGGLGMTVSGKSTHACGMKWVQLFITLTGESGTVWTKRGLVDPNFTLRNGPEAPRKVPERIERLDVSLTAFSVCGTSSAKQFTIILV